MHQGFQTGLPALLSFVTACQRTQYELKSWKPSFFIHCCKDTTSSPRKPTFFGTWYRTSRFSNSPQQPVSPLCTSISERFSSPEKNEIGIYLFIPFRFSKRTKHAHSLHPNFYTPPKKPEAHRAFRAFVFVISKCSEVKKDAEHLLSMSFSVLRRFISPRFRPQR